MRAGVRHEAPTTLTSLHQDYGYDVCATIETTDAVDTMVHFECQGYPHGQYVVVQRLGTGYALVVGELVVVVEGKFPEATFTFMLCLNSPGQNGSHFYKSIFMNKKSFV